MWVSNMLETAEASFWHLYELALEGSQGMGWGFCSSRYQIVMCYNGWMFVDTAVAGEL